ncbi:hypothetical protein [Micromonospora sp. NPDC005652]|uniref:hypothetical protein n=1 Tax=Micromonospora sp. NPDC005652 TaxID=3157046 RepID=UPI0033D1DE03
MADNRTIRDPYEIRPIRGIGDFTYIAAMARYMLGVTDAQGWPAVDELRAVTGEDPLYYNGSWDRIAHMLSEGVRFTEIDALDVDALRARRQAYREELDGGWTPERRAHWTDERIDRTIANYAKFTGAWQSLPAELRNNYTRRQRRPTIQDLIDLLEAGSLVAVTLEPEQERNYGPYVLFYGVDRDTLLGYWPARQAGTLTRMPLAEVERDWPQQFLLAMDRPQN